MTLAIREDTREQKPLDFSKFSQVSVQRATVPVFDYCLEDDILCAVERKSVADFIQSVVITKNYSRELRKISKARKLGMTQLHYVIEGDWRDLENYDWAKFTSNKVHPGLVFRRWREFCVKQNVHVTFAGSPDGAARAVVGILKSMQEQKEISMKEQAEIQEPVTPEETPHHPFGPSSLKSREICPHWQNRGGTSAAAEEGTRLHLACETGDLTGLDEHQIYLVKMCTDYVDALETGDSRRVNEERIEIRDRDDSLLTFGTADVIIVTGDGKHAHVVDYKFGRMSVGDAENNVQGWAYGLGAMQKLGVDFITVHFLLPRRDEVTTAQFSRADNYNQMQLRVSTIIARAKDPRAEYCPDSENCMWCGLKGSCPALAEKALIYAGTSDKLELPTNFNPKDIATGQMHLAIQAAGVLEGWCKDVKEEAKFRIKNGHHIPGYSVKRRSGGRKLTDPKGLYESLLEPNGISIPEFMETANFSMTKIVKMIEETADKEAGQTKKEVKAQFEEASKPFTERKPDTEYLSKARKAKK